MIWWCDILFLILHFDMRRVIYTIMFNLKTYNKKQTFTEKIH